MAPSFECRCLTFWRTIVVKCFLGHSSMSSLVQMGQVISYKKMRCFCYVLHIYLFLNCIVFILFYFILISRIYTVQMWSACSGKSTITHAICLACAGKPEQVGRSSEIKQFVKRDKQDSECYVEIDLLDIDARRVQVWFSRFHFHSHQLSVLFLFFSNFLQFIFLSLTPSHSLFPPITDRQSPY